MQENDENLIDKAKDLDAQIQQLRWRIDDMERMGEQSDAFEIRSRLRELRVEIDDLWIEYDEFQKHGEDPDDARRIYQRFTRISGETGQLEKRIVPVDPFDLALAKFHVQRNETTIAVGLYGTALDRQQWEKIGAAVEECVERRDIRGIERGTREMLELRWHILVAQEHFWEWQLEHLSQPGQAFRDKGEAERQLSMGRDAVARGDRNGASESVRKLWELLPDRDQSVQEKIIMEAGIRRTTRQ